jgi:glutaredoxin 3
MLKYELFGTSSCPYTRDLRELLEWKQLEFVEYDVDEDPAARERMIQVSGQRSVPVLLEDGKVSQVGWQGRACVI